MMWQTSFMRDNKSFAGISRSDQRGVGQPFELLPMCSEIFGSLNRPKQMKIQGHVGRVRDHLTSQLTHNLSGATYVC